MTTSSKVGLVCVCVFFFTLNFQANRPRKRVKRAEQLQLHPFKFINNRNESIETVRICVNATPLEMRIVSLLKSFHASFDCGADSFYLISLKTEKLPQRVYDNGNITAFSVFRFFCACVPTFGKPARDRGDRAQDN